MFELVNALWMMQRRTLIAAHRVDATLAHAQRLGILVDPEPVDQGVLLAMARRAQLTAYDASYLELAARRGMPLATC